MFIYRVILQLVILKQDRENLYSVTYSYIYLNAINPLFLSNDLNHILCSCTMSNDLLENGVDHDFHSDVFMTSVNFDKWRLKSDVSFAIDLKTA